MVIGGRRSVSIGAFASLILAATAAASAWAADPQGEVSAWGTYRPYLIGAGTMATLALALIAGLLLERRGRRQALRALEESHAELVQRVDERERAERQLQENNRQLARRSTSTGGRMNSWPRSDTSCGTRWPRCRSRSGSCASVPTIRNTRSGRAR